MRGGYFSKITEGEINREKRMKEFCERKKHREKCKTCKNKTTDLCHTVRNIDGELQCVFYEKLDI